MPREVELIYICDTLHISYTELIKQPAEWVNTYMLYLSGKNKAENERSKKKN
jgi:hypothetical protein